mmetsp:Transcript_1490/g.3749  ORF Transcript_1490/g.3749 Transcript_1490/m.3749 type:complete len:252 (-) Transcript_1490:238-993(-)
MPSSSDDESPGVAPGCPRDIEAADSCDRMPIRSCEASRFRCPSVSVLNSSAVISAWSSSLSVRGHTLITLVRYADLAASHMGLPSSASSCNCCSEPSAARPSGKQMRLLLRKRRCSCGGRWSAGAPGGDCGESMEASRFRRRLSSTRRDNPPRRLRLVILLPARFRIRRLVTCCRPSTFSIALLWRSSTSSLESVSSPEMTRMLLRPSMSTRRLAAAATGLMSSTALAYRSRKTRLGMPLRLVMALMLLCW